MAKQVLKYLNLIVDGKGYAGQIEEFSPPELTLTTEEFRGGGMDAAIDIETGMEKPTVSFILKGHSTDVLALWGVKKGGNVQLSAKGSLEDLDGTTSAVVHAMQGLITSLAPGTWGPNKVPALTVNMSLRYYRQDVAGQTIHEIDVLNMIRMINGEDQLAEHRANIGL